MRITQLEKSLSENHIKVPEESSEMGIKRINGLDNGRRYLPYQHGVIPEDLFCSTEEDMRFDFLTADEKVEELQSVLQQREEELDHMKGDNIDA